MTWLPGLRSTVSRWSRRHLGFTIALVALLAIVLGSFLRSYWDDEGEAGPASVGPAPPCPRAFVDHIGSAARIRERLERIREGRELLDGLTAEVRYCFGEIDIPAVTEGRLLLLDQRAGADEQAARAGHLIHHVNAGMPFPDEVPADADCDAIVERAIVEEARAYAVEVRLRRELDLPRARYEFEPTFWATPEADREAMIARYLRDHPHGAPNLDGLVSGYRQRCEVERSEASP